MNKKRITDIYIFLSQARMKSMTDEEKVAFIGFMRKLKPLAAEVQGAVADAIAKLRKEYPEDDEKVMQLAEESVSDILAQPAGDVETHVFAPQTFERLCMSNDWTFSQIDELEAALVTTSH